MLLECFRARGIRHLGVDPAGNVVAEAARKGLSVRQASFNEGTACDIATEHGRADVIVAANVICHIADIHSVFAGVRQLLMPSGLFIFEDPYVGSILEQNAFDQIYDEHVFYFSLAAVERIAGMHGLEVIDLCPQPVHGGEMRYYLGVRGAHAPAPSVREWRNREKLSGVCSSPPYRRLAAQAAVIRDTLAETVNRIASDGYRIAGYGATAKSCTVINYCGFTARQIEYIADVTPAKQGKLTPGAHIPVRPPEIFRSSYPDYAVLFAWNHEAEILAKEAPFEAAGGRWITYVPEVVVRPRRAGSTHA